MNKISGVLDAFFETGTEGVIWSLYDDKNNGYDSLHCLENGDYLKVFSESGEIERIKKGECILLPLGWS